MPRSSKKISESWDASGMTSETLDRKIIKPLKNSTQSRKPLKKSHRDTMLAKVNKAILLLESELAQENIYSFPLMPLSYLFTGSLWLLNQLDASNSVRIYSLIPFVIPAVLSVMSDKYTLDDFGCAQQVKDIGRKIGIRIYANTDVDDLLNKFKSIRNKLENELEKGVALVQSRKEAVLQGFFTKTESKTSPLHTFQQSKLFEPHLPTDILKFL